MANKSNWKGFEKAIAEALGGKRRFRTTENFGKTADDILFPKEMRRLYPKVKRVAVECKKRKGTLNIHAFFAEAKQKYCENGKELIFASKITKKGTLKKDIKEYKHKILENSEKVFARRVRKIKKKRGDISRKKKKWVMQDVQREAKQKIALRESQLRASHDITALVTVKLEFFVELWNAWIGRGKDGKPGKSGTD